MSPLPPSVTPNRRRRGRPEVRNGRRGAPTQARLLAIRILERVERAGAFADLALRTALARSDFSSRDRALATELVYGTLRWRGRLDFALSQFLDQDLEALEPLVATTLRMGAYQIFYCDRVPDTAAVDQAVRCIRAAGIERATGLVNAVLRKLAARKEQIEFPTLEEDPLAHLTHALSLPKWIATRWIEVFGAEDAAALARASNEIPPLAIRANPGRNSRQALLDELDSRFEEAANCPHAPLGLILGRNGDPGRDPAFLEGRFSIQDEASQLVVTLLDPQPGEWILDTCAAPGTKSCGIAEQIGETGRVIALDRHERRLDLVSRDARRLGLSNIKTFVRDATAPLGDLPVEKAFDRILVDAPCSGLGTLRRNPDARWRVQPADPGELAKLQRAILHRAADCLGRGGSLVYSTCTVLPEENAEVIQEFLKEHEEFRICSREELPSEVQGLIDEDGWLRCLPHRHNADGFSAVRLVRT